MESAADRNLVGPFPYDIDAELADVEQEFTGRAWVLERLATWIAGHERKFLFVGKAGSGKSALAAHILHAMRGELPSRTESILPNTRIAYAHFCRARDDPSLDPLRFIEAFSEALARGLPGFEQALRAASHERISISGTAAATNVEKGGLVGGVILQVQVRDLAARPAFDWLIRRPLDALSDVASPREQNVVLIDGLDEALTYSQDENLVALLAAVCRPESAWPVWLRFLLTSSSDESRVLQSLGPPSLDLDRDTPPNVDDIADYARLQLSSVPEPPRDAAAKRLSAAAAGNFLYAHLVVRELLRDPLRLETPEEPALPAGLDGYYREYLERELRRPESPQRWEECYRPMLGLLTVSRGDGLDARQLAGASGLAKSSTDDAVKRLRQYLRGPDPDGPFQLFHQSFREFLMTDATYRVYPQEAEETLTRYLIGQISTDSGGGRDWDTQSPYAHAYLASHAAACGMLDELVADPAFLLAAEPKSLMLALGSLRSADARLTGSVYREAHYRLEWTSERDRRSYLELSARRLGAAALADRIRALPGVVAWAPFWSTTMRPRRVLTRHQDFAFALAVADIDGEKVAISGGPDGLVRVTELTTSTAWGTAVTEGGVAVIAQHGNPVGSVALGQIAGSACVIASFSDGLVCARDVRGQSPVINIEPAQDRTRADGTHWTLLATTDKHPFLAICDMTEVVRIWNMELGRYWAPVRHPGGVRALATDQLNGSPVIVSGGFDGTVRVWDLTNGKQYGNSFRAGMGEVRAVGTIVVDGHLVVLASALTPPDAEGYGRLETLKAWDVQTGQAVTPLTQPEFRPDALGTATIGGRAIVAMASFSNVSIIDGRTGASLAPEVHTDSRVICVAPADVGGRVGIVCAQDGGVVELVLADENAASTDPAGLDSLTSVCFVQGEKSAAPSDGGSGSRLNDSAPGVPEATQKRSITSFDFAEAEDRLVVVAGSAPSGNILVRDVVSGEQLADLEATDACEQVRIAYARGRWVVIGIGSHIRVWDADGGLLWQAQLPELTESLLVPPRPMVYSDDTLSAVLWWDFSASHAWDLFTGESLAPTPRRRNIGAAALAIVAGQPVGILGTESGSILTWDLRTGKQLHPPLRCPGGAEAFAVANEQDRLILLAAAGGLCAWDLNQGSPVRSVEDQGKWVTAVAVIRIGEKSVVCTGTHGGRVQIPSLGIGFELDDAVQTLWGISGNRVIVETARGIVGVAVEVT
jgi:WD40 repeat protein